MSGLSRRRFLAFATRAAALAASGLGRVAAAARTAPAGVAAEGGRLRELFRDPPLGARPKTRWWWFGGAVTPEEVTRELTFMRDAGLGGAEIQPLYPLSPDDEARGIRNLSYFTEAFFDVLRHAVREARRLDLQLDFTLGSGWPYGGPFIPTDLSARRLRVLTHDLAGPREFTSLLSPHLTGDDRLVSLVAAPVGPDQGLDLARSVVVPPPARVAGDEGLTLRWAVPPGQWRLLVVVDSPTGQQVKRPTLGMEGPVLDHHNGDAMRLFLRAAGDRVMDALKPAADPPFHSVFCDSLEVYGADWTRDLLAEFRARRGYDLAPRLPALWEEAGPDTPHVRYDYHATLSDLMLEHCFAPLVRWAEQRGMKARIQAHGALADVMRTYGLAHIPEGENIFGGDTCHVNLRHRRLASSAAHVYGRPVVSAETYTWLRTPLFMTTLEMMKAASDSVFLDGINHIVNHGYSYSPPQAGEPGWAFYASTEINHTNTWWRHYPHLARYVRRVQALLQQGAAVNEVAVYLPLADVWSQFGAGGKHIDVEIERHLGTALLTGLRHAGYDFDLVNDHTLAERARVAGGRLQAGSGAYRVVLVPGARWMPVESAARLAELAREGGHLIFLDRLPEGAPGRRDQEARTREVRGIVEGLWAGTPASPGQVVAAGRGSVSLVADAAALIRRLRAVLTPDAELVAGATDADREHVGFVHRRVDTTDLYFLANVSKEPRDLRVRFAAGHRRPERWDPETGTQSAVAYEYVRTARAGTGGGARSATRPVQGGSGGSARAIAVSVGGGPSDPPEMTTDVELRLDPFQSCFVVFGTAADRPRVTRTAPRRPGTAVPLRGPWTLRLGHGEPVPLAELRSWTELPGGSAYSGWAVYETTFDMRGLRSDVDWEIDLGEVHETAEVTLNGRALGAAWKRPRRLPCAGSLQKSANRLTIEVANLWIHDMVQRPTPAEWTTLEETVGIRWGRYGERKPDALPAAGLLGPVRLLPFPRAR
jgi:hypothetical protein